MTKSPISPANWSISGLAAAIKIGILFLALKFRPPSWNETVSPVNENEPPAQSFRIRFTDSRVLRTIFLRWIPIASKPLKPAPIPRAPRPFEYSSIVAIAIAVMAGCRVKGSVTQGPSFILEVC